MKSGWVLYPEYTSVNGFNGLATDDELFALWALDAHLSEDLLSLFREAATDGLAKVLDDSGARAIVRILGEESFRTPPKLSDALDQIFKDGSGILKGAIEKEFRANVALLRTKLMRR